MYLQSNFPRWIVWSRISQFLVSIIILAVSAYASSLLQNPFISLNIFTAILTLIVIPYTFIAPRKLPSFYHVYAEILLEFFLCFFWLVSFASLGSSVSLSGNNVASELGIPNYNGDNAQLNSLINNTNEALACSKAVAVFGALMFFLTLANFIFTAVYALRMRRAARQSGINNTNNADPGMVEEYNAPVPSVIPLGFTQDVKM